MHSPEVMAEMRKNRDAFEEVRVQLEAEHWGGTALYNNGVMIAIYNDEGDAYQIGCEKFGMGRFSLQKVGARPIDLGFQGIILGFWAAQSA